MGNTIKSSSSKDNEILLTPGSSRRKMLWKRLQNSKPEKGLNQDQVSRYLQTFMKQHYQKVRKEGALTFDKVQRYLDYLAKLASGTLSKVSMEQSSVASYSEKIKPVIEDVGTKTAITDEDVQKHSNEIRSQAQQHIQQISPAKDVNKRATSEYKKESGRPDYQMRSPVVPEPIQPVVPIKKGSEEIAKSQPHSDLLYQDIVPIGLEEGAPLVSLKTFLNFPLSALEVAPEPDKRFDMHLKYLELAVKESCFKNENLVTVKTMLRDLPEKRYSKYFDIFPENEYDDAQLTIIFSQWRNQTLNRFLIENEDES